MPFIFTREPLEDALLPQISHAMKVRIEALSRLKYPALWEHSDKAAAADTPEKKASRDKAAAIRHRLWGVVLCVLGVILFVPGLTQPKGLTVPLVVGGAAILLGLSRLFGKYVSAQDKQQMRYDASARQLLTQLNRGQETGAPTLIFEEDALTMRMQGGEEQTVPYTAFEYVIEEEDLILVTFGTKVTVVRKSELCEGEINAFLPYLEERTTVLYLHPAEQSE